MRTFSWGVLAMASAVAALFFLRYWRVSRERLFAFFALAFAGLAVNWTWLAVVNHPYGEAQDYVYIVRLIAFLILLAGIIDKNSRSRGA